MKLSGNGPLWWTVLTLPSMTYCGFVAKLPDAVARAASTRVSAKQTDERESPQEA